MGKNKYNSEDSDSDYYKHKSKKHKKSWHRSDNEEDKKTKDKKDKKNREYEQRNIKLKEDANKKKKKDHQNTNIIFEQKIHKSSLGDNQNSHFDTTVINSSNKERYKDSSEKVKKSGNGEIKQGMQKINAPSMDNKNEKHAPKEVKISFSRYLTKEEQELLWFGIRHLEEEIREFSANEKIRIENKKIKITIENETNQEQTIMHKLNELRLILDKYSIATFKFWDEASKFTLRVFEDILDTALDIPYDFKTNEMHLQKGKSIKWMIDNSPPLLSCILAGRNNEVNACLRFLHWFNKLIVSESFSSGFLTIDNNSEEEGTSILEKNHTYYTINSDKKEGKIYLSYIKHKVSPDSLERIREDISKDKQEVKEHSDTNRQIEPKKKNKDNIDETDDAGNKIKKINIKRIVNAKAIKIISKDKMKENKEKHKKKMEKYNNSNDGSDSEDSSENKNKLGKKKIGKRDSSED